MRIKAALAAIALLGSVAACGSSSAAEGGPVTLRMTTWSANEAHVKLFNDIAAEYKTTHPDVTVQFDACRSTRTRRR